MSVGYGRLFGYDACPVIVGACLLMLVACAPQSAAPPKPDTPTVPVAAQLPTSWPPPATKPSPTLLNPSDLAGGWRIVSVNGVAPIALGEDGGGQRMPSLFFSPAGYGGTTGCNYIGGLGLLHEGRYYTAPGPQTQMGCGNLERQESAITGVLGLAPRVSLGADGLVTLTNGSTAMVLRRHPALPRRRAGPGASRGLPGATVRIRSLDNRGIGAPDGGSLRFTASELTARAACATLSGAWRQEADRIVLVENLVTTEQLCAPAEAVVDATMATLLGAKPHFLIGPNGEVLMAGGGHWLVGQIER